MIPTTSIDSMQSAAPDARQQSSQYTEGYKLVTFRLDQHRFAVPVEQVWRVEALSDFPITRVPGAAAFLEGLINLRGRVIPVIDLKKRLGLLSDTGTVSTSPGTVSAFPPKTRLLIVEMDIAGQKDEKVAMIADTVNDIRWFSAANLTPPPPIVAGISSHYLLGVLEEGGKLWIVLELRQVLSVEERNAIISEAEKGQKANTISPYPQTSNEMPTEGS